VKPLLIVEVVGALVVGGSVFVAQKTDSFWGDSVQTYINTTVGVFAIVAGVYAAYQVVRKPWKDALAAMEKGCDEKIARNKQAMEHEYDKFRSSFEAMINKYHATVDRQMAVFDNRVKAVEDDGITNNGILRGLTDSMAESRQDRRNLGEGQRRIETMFLEYRRERQEHDRQIMDAINHRNREPR
jgi:hypothetical protein